MDTVSAVLPMSTIQSVSFGHRHWIAGFEVLELTEHEDFERKLPSQSLLTTEELCVCNNFRFSWANRKTMKNHFSGDRQ